MKQWQNLPAESFHTNAVLMLALRFHHRRRSNCLLQQKMAASKANQLVFVIAMPHQVDKCNLTNNLNVEEK